MREKIDKDTTIYVIIADDNFYNNLTEEESKKIMLEDNEVNHSYGYTTSKSREKIEIGKYYGFYNGACVASLGRFSQWHSDEEILIDGVVIYIWQVMRPCVWYKGDFYNLITAYENNIITKDNLIAIADASTEGLRKILEEYENNK